ncbi:MAG: hypothetical protein II939_00755 [Bacteroidales bacterium]|nr:hypothetical protein [Bacteroidales bacterium]
MGLFRIIKGLVQVGEGLLTGDGEKLGKGVANTAIGVVTTVTATDDDDTDDDTDGYD